jgi:hypothetical protein
LPAIVANKANVLYTIETNDEEKGTIADTYGPNNHSCVTNFMQGVKIHKVDITDY